MNDKKILQIHNKIFRIPLSLFTGSCGTLAFSPYNFWPASIFSLMGLLVVILNCNCRQSSYLSFFWGIGLFGTGINWIHISIDQFGNIPKLINIISTIVIIVYLTFYPIIFSILLSQIWPSTNFCRLIFASPILWSLTEFLRSYLFNGFPWLQFGYSQINSPFKGLVPILGVEGTTFILMLISGLLTFITVKKCSIFIIINTMIFIVSLWSLQLINWYYLEPEKNIKITLIQGNIDQKIKYNIDYISQILKIYLKLSFKNTNNSQIIIWPESAIPGNEITQNFFLKKLDLIAKKNHVSLITGIIDKRSTSNGYQYYNSIIVLGDTIPYYYLNNNRYTKYHLVPFGETMPLKKILIPLLSFLHFDFFCFTQGEYLQSQLVASNTKFTPSICYEIIFGNRIRNNFYYDTDFLLTISNNSWFGHSIEPWQHLQMAQMRALELGRPLIHSTNNGITAFIRADGTLQDTLPQFIEGYLTNEIIPTKGITPYARFGTYPLQIISIIFGIFSIKYRKTI